MISTKHLNQLNVSCRECELVQKDQQRLLSSELHTVLESDTP